MFELVEPGSSRIRIRLVKVMNLETLRHNCLTPPAAAELVVPCSGCVCWRYL